MKTTNAEQYAEIAYNAYRQGSGKLLPDYKDMSGDTKAGWMHAAAAVLEADNDGIAEMVEETAKLFEELAQRFRGTYKAFGGKDTKE